MSSIPTNPNLSNIAELLFQALETEQGGILVYETAITCAVNDDLREEWEEYLEETRTHERVMRQVLADFGLDPEQETPGRDVVRGIAAALVEAMVKAKANATPEQAEIVACEAVVHAETKDHSNWELMGLVAEQWDDPRSEILQAAYEAVEDQEDHHLYHTKGWCRESWIQAMGFPAVLPPPEEVKQVQSAIGAAKAEKQRDDML